MSKKQLLKKRYGGLYEAMSWQFEADVAGLGRRLVRFGADDTLLSLSPWERSRSMPDTPC